MLSRRRRGAYIADYLCTNSGKHEDNAGETGEWYTASILIELLPHHRSLTLVVTGDSRVIGYQPQPKGAPITGNGLHEAA